jgi:hypothetical protein
LQDELMRVRTSQREQQAAAAREAELVAADLFPEVLLTSLWLPLVVLPAFLVVFAGGAEVGACLLGKAAHSLDSWCQLFHPYPLTKYRLVPRMPAG